MTLFPPLSENLFNVTNSEGAASVFATALIDDLAESKEEFTSVVHRAPKSEQAVCGSPVQRDQIRGCRFSCDGID